MPRTDLPNRCEIAVRRDDDPALTLDGFEQDRDGVLGDGGLDGRGVAIGDDREAGRERGVALPRNRVRREADDGRRPTVEVAVHDDDIGPFRVDLLDLDAPFAAHLDGGLDGLGTGVHREDHVLAGELGQLAGKLPEPVVEERAARQRQGGELLLRARHQPRVGVAEVERRVPGEAVEVLPSLDIPHPGTLAAVEHDLERVIVVGGVPLDHRDVVGRGHRDRCSGHVDLPSSGRCRCRWPAAAPVGATAGSSRLRYSPTGRATRGGSVFASR